MAAKKKNNMLILEFVGGILAVIVGLLTLQFLRGSKTKAKSKSKSRKKRVSRKKK